MFLQIHTLTSYPASLLNRDDAGLAKRIPFGNAVRLRVSSQCLKRHWRETLVNFEEVKEKDIGIPDGYRSRYIFEQIYEELRTSGFSEDEAKSLALCVKKLTMDTSRKDENTTATDSDERSSKVLKGKSLNDDLKIQQPIFLSRPEVEFLLGVAKKIKDHHQDLNEALILSEPITKNDKKKKEKTNFRNAIGLDKDNIEAMKKSARGYTASLFGRMSTSDIFARVDAPVHVAHSFTVHPASTEMDYFTVVDDLSKDEDTGAAHINQAELGAGLYYGYVAVDIPLLVSNLTGCEPKDWRSQEQDLPRRVLEALITSILQQSPGAKKGSTAPYAWADLLLLETGQAQPRTLANAFLEAIPYRGADRDLRLIATGRLAKYVAELDAMYGRAEGYRGLSASLDPIPDNLPSRQPVTDNVRAALDAIWG